MVCVCVGGGGGGGVNRKQKTNNRYSEEMYNCVHCKQLEVDLTPKNSFQLQSRFIQVVTHLLSRLQPLSSQEFQHKTMS